ncbi:Protein of unknown function [Cotesia congregata]|uniref:Uncharacterized protein n=1 Tax=Cotesia congregata TaxID=51543 RepID=A0A8J2MU96_COTCN|nr:Protein of unknown function [Cotesia congregata]
MTYLWRNCSLNENKYILSEKLKTYGNTKPHPRFVKNSANNLKLKRFLASHKILAKLVQWNDMLNSLSDEFCEQETSGCELNEVKAITSTDSIRHTVPKLPADSGSKAIATPTLPMNTWQNVPAEMAQPPSSSGDQKAECRSMATNASSKLGTEKTKIVTPHSGKTKADTHSISASNLIAASSKIRPVKTIEQSNFSNDSHKCTQFSSAIKTEVQPIEPSAEIMLETANTPTLPPSAEPTPPLINLRPVSPIPSTSRLHQAGTSDQQTTHQAKKKMTVRDLYPMECDEIDSELTDVINKTQKCRSIMRKLFQRNVPFASASDVI